MSTMEFAERLMAPYGPQVRIPELVEQLNRFYHAREASVYDRQHPEIFGQITGIWETMLRVGVATENDGALRVLDVGCGTGFEATRLLESPYAARIEELVCYDPSIEMLNVCRANLDRFPRNIRFVDELDVGAHAPGRFNVFPTNSLLHHLPDPLDTVREISPLLSDDAVWLAGHEPSNRFYRNAECRNVLLQYTKQISLRRFFSPAIWRVAARRVLRPNSDPLCYAAKRAYESGLLRKLPSPRAVGRLVDLHVAHDLAEVQAGRGFDFAEMAKTLLGEWDLRWKHTYNFMGSYREWSLSSRWRGACSALAEKHPDDGSNFCAVWRRHRKRKGGH